MKYQGFCYSAHNCGTSSLLGIDVEIRRKSVTPLKKPIYKNDNLGKIQYHT
jgi:hypothetical protein